jgi:photosystem II stability/assembly factor-like uncharacterized protein
MKRKEPLMNKRLLFVLSLLLIGAIAASYIVFINQETKQETVINSVITTDEDGSLVQDNKVEKNLNQPDKTEAEVQNRVDLSIADEKDFLKDNDEGFEKDESYTSSEKKELMGLVPQREMIVEGKDKSDRPDLFAEWQFGIRTKYGEDKPGYSYNYKMKEFLKQKNLLKSSNKIAKISALNWVERGPGNISGRTRGIIVDPDDATFDTWIVGSVSGGIWKTTDAGATWTDLTPDLPNLATSTLAMAESNHDVIYAGTGEGFFNVDQVDGSGMWKSTDRGATWNALPSTTNNPDFQNITRIIVDPSDENTVLASAGPGFYYQSFSALAPSSKIHRSTDGGATWNVVYDAGLNTIEQIVANPLNFNTQYATINSTGVIKSVDGGQTWNDASNGIGEVLRMELAVAPTDTSTVYIAAEGGASGSVLYISDDGGDNWLPASDTTGVDKNWLGAQGWYDNTIAVDPYDKNQIYVGGINLFRLDRVAGTDTSDVMVTGVDFENTSSFFSVVNWGGPYAGGGIGTGDDFLGSFAVGDTDYTSVEIRFGPGLLQMAHRFVRNPSTGDYEYQDYVEVPFEVWDIDNNVQLMFSFRDWADDGAFDLIPFDGGNPQREYMFINAIEYSATPSPFIAQTNGFVVKNIWAIWPILADGGVWDPDNLPSSVIRINWGSVVTQRIVANVLTDAYGQFGGTSKGVHVDHHNITLVKTDEMSESFRLVNGNDGGVSYSDDKGATFEQPTNGYNTTQFYGVDKMNGADRYIGGTQDNGSWLSPLNPDNTSAWVGTPGGDGFEAVWHYNDPNLILESSQFNSIYKTTDGGASWNSAGATNGLSDPIGPFFTKLAKSKQDPDLVFAVGSLGAWRSDDFADSWTLSPITSGFNGSLNFSQVKISLVNPQVVWTGQSMSPSGSIFVSVDGGLTFNATTNDTDVTLGRISSIETDPADDSTAYVLFSFAKTSKILKTTDLGQTWTDISGFGTDTVSSTGFPDVAVFSLLVMPFNTDIIWAGTEIGIFESTDGGGTWAYSTSSLPAVAVYEMVIVNDEVVVATHGRGVWSISIPELAGYEPPATTLSPRLSPIAQNPSGTLVIPFSLRSAYDSSHVMVNKMVYASLPANASPKDSTIYYAVMATQTDTVQVVAYKDGIEYKSFERTSDDILLAEPVLAYINNFNMVTEDFTGSGFVVDTPTGFSDPAIHSGHTYPDNTNSVYYLLVPIIVAASNATMEYDDIAIVEPGESGSVYGDGDFYDYVVVEATKDGVNWLSLADGYDARKDTAWLSAYIASASGDSSLFRTQSINLLDTFSAGDTILIRFRLFADANTNGWGWTIDDLVIQEGYVPVELASFTVSADENKILLKWETATEKNNLGFDVERSTDDKNFTRIGHVHGKGTTTEKQSYSYLDQSTNGGKFYYRLKQIDFDGQFHYSNSIEVTTLPTVYSLSQNYPNPFNPSTTIKFQIPKQERVVLEIYNSLGEKVATLVDEIKDAGFYQSTWNGINNNNNLVSSGVYIYRIIAGDFVVSKKMMYLK